MNKIPDLLWPQLFTAIQWMVVNTITSSKNIEVTDAEGVYKSISFTLRIREQLTFTATDEKIGPGLEFFAFYPQEEGGYIPALSPFHPAMLDRLIETARANEMKFLLIRDFRDWLTHFDIGDFESRGFHAASSSGWEAGANAVIIFLN